MVAEGASSRGTRDEAADFEEIFAAYVERLNRGEECHPQEILARHPTIAEQLLACLEDYVGSRPPAHEPVGRILGDYVLRREIGRGGMGVVYEAWQTSLERRVALKVLPVGIAADDRSFHRFMREAKTAARLDHQNVVRVFGMGVESDTPYFAMELVEGETLAEILERGATHVTDELGDHQRIALAFADVADGLAHAHFKGIVHRDVKPSNLIRDREGRLRILDFGLARLEGQEGLTQSDAVVGTPLYMSPEQMLRRRAQVDHRTDVYSLGATLYEVLTGQPPFRGRSNAETLSQILEQDPLPLRRRDPTISRDLETIVLKCLRKSPRDRYETATALAADLRRFARGEPIEARPQPSWEKALRWSERRWRRVGGVAVILTPLAFAAYSLLPSHDMVQQRLLTTDDMELNDFWDMRPSPDGRQVAFTRMETDGSLWVRDLESGESTQLASGEYTARPVWSPDGKRIAYRVWSPAEALKIVDVASRTSFMTANTDGLELTPLDWSPDGERLLCAREVGATTASLVSLALERGEVTTLATEGMHVTSTALFSPDGKLIACSAVENGNREVFVMRPDGSEKRRLTNAPGGARYPLWSPEGDLLVYQGRDGLWGIDFAGDEPGGAPQFLRSEAFGEPLAWVAEGLFYRVHNGTRRFYQLPLDPRSAEPGGPPSPLLERTVKLAYRFVWSPDMGRIACSTYDDLLIHLYSTADRSLRSFETGADQRWTNMWWSADGKQIYFEVQGGAGTITALDVSSGERKDLFPPLEDVERMHLHPDGKHMLFYRWNGLRDNGRRELVVAQIGSRDGRVLAAEEDEEVGSFSNSVSPVFSPDGSQVLFATAAGDLWLAATNGTRTRMLASSPMTRWQGQSSKFVQSAVWHPDGKRVVYDNGNDLFAVDVESGEQERLALPVDRLGFIDGLWQCSPDGTRLALTLGMGGGPELWVVRNLPWTK